MTLTQQLQETFIQTHPLEVAQWLEGLPIEQTEHLLKNMDSERVASLLLYFLPGRAADILQRYNFASSAEILNLLPINRTQAVLRQLDAPIQKNTLEHFSPHVKEFFRRTLHLSEQCAGNLADPHVLTLPSDITVEQAIPRVAQSANQATYYLYILDREARLRGVVLMKELLAADPRGILENIMTPNVKAIPSSTNAHDAILHPAWAQFDILPVIDSDRIFMGGLRHRALRSFLQGRPGDPRSGFLSDALLQLWEVYSLSGIGLMTTLGDVLKASRPEFYSPENRSVHEDPTRTQ